jgi:hypothetical protein
VTEVTDVIAATALSNQRFVIGQVLYLIPRTAGRPNIMPVQVFEESTRKTVHGSSVSYTVRAPGDEETFPLDGELYEVFPSATAIQAELRRRAVAAIDAMVDSAVNTATVHFPDAAPGSEMPQNNPEITTVTTTSSSKNSGTHQVGPITVQLPDGSIARVSMPENV